MSHPQTIGRLSFYLVIRVRQQVIVNCDRSGLDQRLGRRRSGGGGVILNLFLVLIFLWFDWQLLDQLLVYAVHDDINVTDGEETATTV